MKVLNVESGRLGGVTAVLVEVQGSYVHRMIVDLIVEGVRVVVIELVGW